MRSFSSQALADYSARRGEGDLLHKTYDCCLNARLNGAPRPAGELRPRLRRWVVSEGRAVGSRYALHLSRVGGDLPRGCATR